MKLSMKTIGFIKEMDKGKIREEYWSVEDSNYSAIDETEKEKILEYLTKAHFVGSIMCDMFDGETDLGSYVIYSDGEWMWPSHFPYFLNKKNTIDTSFLQHIRNNNYTPPLLTKEKEKEVGTFYEVYLLDVKIPKWIKKQLEQN